MRVIASVLELSFMRVWINMHACDYDRSAAHGAQWQELELIFGQLLLHGNMRERRERVVHVSLRPTETFMRACRGPTEAAWFRAQTIISWLLPALKGFYDMHAQLTSVSYIQAKRRVRYVYTQTQIGVFFVHGNGNTHACLTQGWNLFYFDGCHL